MSRTHEVVGFDVTLTSCEPSHLKEREWKIEICQEWWDSSASTHTGQWSHYGCSQVAQTWKRPPRSCEVTLYWLILTTTVFFCARTPAWWHTGKICQILKDSCGHRVTRFWLVDGNVWRKKTKNKIVIWTCRSGAEQWCWSIYRALYRVRWRLKKPARHTRVQPAERAMAEEQVGLLQACWLSSLM